MKKAFRITRFFLLLFFFLSCQNKKEPVKETDTTKNDSNRIVNPESFSNPYAGVDVSPMDMSYYPVDYPKLKMANSVSSPPVMRVIYSRPHLNGRELFHNLLKYGEPWRMGANEATEIQFFQEVTIQGKKILAGRYILYCIPKENDWSIVINNNTDTWGLKIDSTKDLDRFNVPVTHNNPSLEYLTIVFEKADHGAVLMMAWADLIAKLPIDF